MIHESSFIVGLPKATEFSAGDSDVKFMFGSSVYFGFGFGGAIGINFSELTRQMEAARMNLGQGCPE